MATFTDHDGEVVVAPCTHARHDAVFGDSGKIIALGKQAVARHPKSRQVGDGSTGTKYAESMLAVLNPFAVKLVVKSRRTAVDKAVQDS